MCMSDNVGACVKCLYECMSMCLSIKGKLATVSL